MKGLIGCIFIFAILCFSVGEAKAVTVTGQAPYYGGATAIDAAITPIFWQSQLDKVKAELDKYDNQEKLAKGFANANAFSSNVASLEGYQDYNLFAVMTGVMISLQAPAFTYDKEYVNRMRYKIERDGDAYLGVGVGLAVINAGVNAGFIFPGMYINLKYGQIAVNAKNINSQMEGFTYKELLLGGGINQILFWPRTAIPGVLKWRGLSIGTGFYYTKTENSITILKSLMTESVATYNLIIDPTFKIQVKSETMTIPLDVSTSFILFSIFNFSLGTGVDFNLGHSEIKLKAAGSVTTDDNVDTLVTPGYIIVEGGTKEKKPTTINPKITAGIGFNISVVKIDIPFAVYYLDSGFSIGLSAGIVW